MSKSFKSYLFLKVAWLLSYTKILAIHTHMVTNNPRMSVTHNGRDSWTLKIDNVQQNDSGLYSCQINTEPMTIQVGALNVGYPPDIIIGPNTSNDTIVAEGDSVTLRCEVTGYPEPTVNWAREDQTPLVQRNHQGKITRTLSQHQKISEGNELKLEGLTRSDMGAYLCYAKNGIPPSISKRIRVLDHLPQAGKVQDQIIRTQLGSTVTLKCSVEAYPTSEFLWFKSRNGEETMINSSDDHYKLTDHNPQKYMYSFETSLTIVGVKPSDLGNYTCSSYGRVRGWGIIQLASMILFLFQFQFN